jgi:hypothetical protein
MIISIQPYLSFPFRLPFAAPKQYAAAALEGGETPRDLCARLFKAHGRCVFNGNG